MRIAQASQPDFLDPALSYTIHGWEPMWTVYTPLLTYKREEGDAGSELMPGLAEDMPEISADGKTYELTLRKGIKYSDGTPVKASDFEHAIKRVLNLESGGAPYYEVIEGADAYLSGGNAEADIPGIKTNDKTGEITIELAAPEGAFSFVLAMNFASLVPGDTPFENMTKDPVPGVGAYMFTKSVPNREFVLERNPEFSEATVPGVPVANIDTINTEIIPSVPQQTQEVIDNKLDFMEEPPAADFVAEILERFGPDGSEEQRFKEFTTLSTYYFFLNGKVAAVRRSQSSRSGQPRDRQAGPCPTLRRHPRTRLLVPAAGNAGLQRVPRRRAAARGATRASRPTSSAPDS